MTTIHEFQQVLWVNTKLVPGIVILAIDYGPQENIIFLVALENGEFKHFNTNQITIYKNNTLEINEGRTSSEDSTTNR